MTDLRFAQIESHRPCLLRHALAQLRDDRLAEEGLTSILRSKAIELLRRPHPNPPKENEP